jgi:hypothetical protein
MTQAPAGQERRVEFIGGAAIDGAPVAYIVVLAAVCTALAFIPFSVVLASGGSFPMSQGVFPLVGWVLGPIAGAVASGVGSLIGVFVAPHTAGVPVVTVLGAATASFIAGLMRTDQKRQGWVLPIAVVGVVCLALFAGRAVVQNGVGLWPAFAGSFLDWSALLLFVLPTRKLVGKWLKSSNIGLVVAGLALGTWTAFGMSHLLQTTITYFMFNWPEDVWTMLIPIIPMENFFRCVIGVVIGTGVIAGLRAIGLVKPSEAVY